MIAGKINQVSLSREVRGGSAPSISPSPLRREIRPVDLPRAGGTRHVGPPSPPSGDGASLSLLPEPDRDDGRVSVPRPRSAASRILEPSGAFAGPRPSPPPPRPRAPKPRVPPLSRRPGRRPSALRRPRGEGASFPPTPYAAPAPSAKLPTLSLELATRPSSE